MTITITQERPDTPEALQLLAELDVALGNEHYPPQSRHAFSVEKLIRQNVAFFVIRVDGNPAGCGGVKLFGADYGEVKRMFVRPAFRGKGLGKAMLDHIAQYTRGHGVSALRLETGIYQREAIGLYESWGFARRAPFGDYQEDPLSIYYERELVL